MRRLAEKPPDLAVYVIDSSNAERGLYPALQLVDMGIPFLIALNMADEAKKTESALIAVRLRKSSAVR